MNRLHVEADAYTSAPPDAVWRLVVDASSYCRWGPWRASGTQEVGGDGGPGGQGSVRWLRYGRTTTVERVLEVDEGRRLVYTVVKGIPVRDYRAEVTIRPEGRRTHVRWSASWKRTLPGRLVHRKLRSLYPEVVAQLCVEAERQAASP